MTIQEMLEREDIYEILKKTMTEYYEVVHHKKITVQIQKKHFGKKYLIYPRLGIIISRFPSWAVIKRTFVSFDVKGNIFKKIVAWTYITICLLSFGLLADASYIISDSSVFTKDMIIIPSNRKIRIYDYKNGYVDSYLKDGFHKNYFNREIEVRKNPQYPYILGFLELGERWYREELLRGRCLVRCSRSQYDIYVNNVVEYLSQYYAGSVSYKKAYSYAVDLQKEYLPLIEKIEKEKQISCGKELISLINRLVELCRINDEEIALVPTHGDLQNGNIYVDEKKNKLYIIDWETTKIKSIWYDAATLLCATRRKDNFSSMINRRKESEIMQNILKCDSIPRDNMDLVAAVLILDELGFFLDEIVDLPGSMGREIIDRFTYEVDRIDWGTFNG